MKKNAGTICWIIGAIIWGVTASICFSEGKTGFATVQVVIAILYLFHAIRRYIINKQE